MITYIVCEESTDAKLLNCVLPKQFHSDLRVEIVAAGGLSAVKSLARSLVIRRQMPVAIVVDSDSVAPEFIQERREDIEEIVKSVAGNIPVKVFVFIPEIEVIFFQNIPFLERLIGYKPDRAILNLAGFQPRKVLDQLIAQSEKIDNYSEFINQLSHEDAKILSQAPIIQEIIHFLESVSETATAI